MWRRRQDHRGVEADDRRPARDVEDRPDDRFANVGLEVVELGRVVPRKRRAVIAVVDEAGLAAAAIPAAEDDGRIGRVPVVVLERDLDRGVG